MCFNVLEGGHSYWSVQVSLQQKLKKKHLNLTNFTSFSRIVLFMSFVARNHTIWKFRRQDSTFRCVRFMNRPLNQSHIYDFFQLYLVWAFFPQKTYFLLIYKNYVWPTRRTGQPATEDISLPDQSRKSKTHLWKITLWNRKWMRRQYVTSILSQWSCSIEEAVKSNKDRGWCRQGIIETNEMQQ